MTGTHEARATAPTWWEAQVRRLSGLLAVAFPTRAWLRELHGQPPDLAELRSTGEALIAALRSPTADAMATANITRTCRLTGLELDLLGLALLPELNDRFGDLFADARGSATARRPTLGLALRILLPEGAPLTLPWDLAHHSTLWSRGLLRGQPPEVALADRELITSASTSVVLGSMPASLGQDVAVQRAWMAGDPARITQLRPSLARLVSDLVPLSGPDVVFYLSTSQPASARPLAHLLAALLDHPLLHVGPIGEAALSTLREVPLLAWAGLSLLWVEIAEGVRQVSLPEGWTTPVPVLLVIGRDTRLTAPETVRLHRVESTLPGPAEQAEAWRVLLTEVGGAARTDVLGNRNRLPLELLERVVSLAQTRARVRGLAGPEDHDVTHALKELDRPPALSTGELCWPSVDLSELVLPPRIRTALDDILRRVEHRVTVQDRWGIRGHSSRGNGVIALFHGESGTGKTLAVDTIATSLGLPLLRVDLSRVVSKYIGETEKNLSSVFDAAEGFGALLFFDEADSLFSRRTGVSDAHDRWANLETNYLLQRLETFEGIAVLASNALHNVDEAFMRRIPHQIHFPRPSRQLQRQLWDRHLPAAVRAPDVNLDVLCQRLDLVGGEIRNAVIAAAYQAASRGGLVEQGMLEGAVREEMVKKGRAV